MKRSLPTLLGRFLVGFALCACAAPVSAQDQGVPGDEAIGAVSVEKQRAAAEGIMPSLVVVRVYARYDKGDAPAWSHSQQVDWDGYIDEERPYEMFGLVTGDREVWTMDDFPQERFIDRIEVVKGSEVRTATLSGLTDRLYAASIELEEALPNTRPATFTDGIPDEMLAAQFFESEGHWTLTLSPARETIEFRASGDNVRVLHAGQFTIDPEGKVVGFTMVDRLPESDPWAGHPGELPGVTTDELADAFDSIESGAQSVIPRASLRFRSPRSSNSGAMSWMMSGYGEDSEITSWDGPAIMLDNEHALVLVSLEPRTTARLERITLFDGSDDAGSPAEFVGTLKDYGAFIARLESPRETSPNLDTDGRLYEMRDRLLAELQLTIQDDHRETEILRARVGSFSLGRRALVFPNYWTAGNMGRYYGYGYAGGGQSKESFLFTLDGELLAIPLAERKPVSVEEEWDSNEAIMTPVAHLTPIIESPASASFDANNIPLSEEDELRLAWLGVEMQPMDPEIARINGILDLTADGSSGATVSYVYKDSPASRAGLKQGDVLLRVHCDSQPRPIEIMGEENPMAGFMGPEFWAQLDMIPPEMLDQLPEPWPTADNEFNRSLTALGAGTDFELEYVPAGASEPERLPMQVVYGPDHYASATRHKSEPLGTTVRELTYEVRRFMRVLEDEPGVIVSRIEPGQPGAVAGLRPFEIIEQVDGTPIHTVEDFIEAVGGADTDLEFTTKRFNETRVVRIRAR